MPIPLSSVTASTVKGAIVPIQTIIADGSFAAFDFQNIPQGFQDLMLIFSIRNQQNSTGLTTLYLWANTDVDAGTGNYNYVYTGSNGSSILGARGVNQNQLVIGATPNLNSTSGVYSQVIVNLLGYSNTTTFKTFLSRTAADLNSAGDTYLIAGVRRSTQAINRLYFRNDGGAAITYGSTATLYGVRGPNQ